jgi:hypothetical protein
VTPQQPLLEPVVERNNQFELSTASFSHSVNEEKREGQCCFNLPERVFDGAEGGSVTTAVK